MIMKGCVQWNLFTIAKTALAGLKPGPLDHNLAVNLLSYRSSQCRRNLFCKVWNMLNLNIGMFFSLCYFV